VTWVRPRMHNHISEPCLISLQSTGWNNVRVDRHAAIISSETDRCRAAEWNRTGRTAYGESVILSDRLIRTVIPSSAKLSYNALFRVIGNAISGIPSLLYREFRGLPPNHLRVRVGVANKLLFNQAYHLQVGAGFWLSWLSSGYVKADSDILEIGCGCGRVAHQLRGDWFVGSYVGIDIDREALDWCALHFPSPKFAFLPSPHVSATYASRPSPEGAPITFPADWEQDFIFSTSLYTHLLEDELDNYTREAFRVLRPNGTMYMTFFCLDSVELGNRWTFSHKIGEAFVENIKYPEAAVAYRRAYMERLCYSVGFNYVSIIEGPGQSSLICRK
jgi:SAM-dependent methyltransferase